MKINGYEIGPEEDLYKANLRGAHLRGAHLRGADLYKANLRGADLCEADLCEANLCRANLCGANLGSQSVIDGGQDRRGYRFVGVSRDTGFMVAAGCRWFTFHEALHWWTGSGKSTNAAECLAKVEMIAAEAARRGWEV